MIKPVLLFCFSLLTFSCSNTYSKAKSNFDSFIFSYSALHSDYSFKINQSDTAYYIQRFPKPIRKYYTILSSETKDSIAQIIGTINFNNYDSLYDQITLEDGDSYKLVLNNRSAKRWIFIHGHEAPQELYKSIKSLMKIKETQSFKVTNASIDFDNLNYILVPTASSENFKK